MRPIAPQRAYNVPPDVTPLVGRRSETAAVKSLLSEARLVTLTGIGGVGKTRLAVHIARQVQRAFPDGVCFVPLADLTQPELLSLTVLSTLTQAERPVAAAADLVYHIDGRRLLLVLDNCEHLVEECAALAGELLRTCESLHVLATSQERLRVEGEVVYRVPPLAVPDSTHGLSPHRAGEYDAISLFIQRASAVNSALRLNPEDIPALVDLCRRLEGLPLAIELVAGRAGTLPIASLVSSEADQFRLVTGGSRTAPRRHQTLRATVDHSFELCSDQARRLWARMSVFAGGADLEALRRVCGDQELSADDLERSLSELVDKSILSFDGRRYRMLGAIREYGIARLREQGEDVAVRRAHRDHFAALARRASDWTSGAGRLSFLQEALAEQANIRTALEFCVTEPGEVTAGLAMAAGLWEYWLGCGLHREGRHWLDALLRASQDPSPERVVALWVDGHLAVATGAAPEALALASQCEVLAISLGDRESVAHATSVAGLAKLLEGDVEEGIARLEEAVRLEREVRRPNALLAPAMSALGVGLICRGDLSDAFEILDEARQICFAEGDELQQSWALLWLGLVALLDGRLGEAEQLVKDVLVRNQAINDRWGIGTAMEILAWTRLAQGDAARAAVLMGASEAMTGPLSHLGDLPGLHDWHEEQGRQVEAQLGSRAFQAACNRGRRMDIAEGIRFATDRGDQGSAEPKPSPASSLTPRELEVARLVAEGGSNKEIAAALVISIRTAEAHVENILRKLGLNSRTQIAATFAAAEAKSE